MPQICWLAADTRKLENITSPHFFAQENTTHILTLAAGQSVRQMGAQQTFPSHTPGCEYEAISAETEHQTRRERERERERESERERERERESERESERERERAIERKGERE